MNQDEEQNTNIAVLVERLKNFDSKLDCMANKITVFNKKLDDHYITKTEFSPIKKLYDKLVGFSLGVIFLVGGAGIAIVFLIKTKLFN